MYPALLENSSGKDITLFSWRLQQRIDRFAVRVLQGLKGNSPNKNSVDWSPPLWHSVYSLLLCVFTTVFFFQELSVVITSSQVGTSKNMKGEISGAPKLYSHVLKYPETMGAISNGSCENHFLGDIQAMVIKIILGKSFKLSPAQELGSRTK